MSGGRAYIGAVMSNSDEEIVEETAERLKTEHVYATYTGRTFCGEVWWDEAFRFEDLHNSAPQEVVAGTLQEIMDQVSERRADD